VDGLTKGAAAELGPKGIRVNAVSPGVIDTNLFTAAQLPSDWIKASVTKSNPLGRIGTVEDVAHAVSFFADGAKSGYVTGANLLADGGYNARS